MALKKPSTQQILGIVTKTLDGHEKDIAEQKSITKFFTIVVAATLVATLVGLGGLYISAFKEKNGVDLESTTDYLELQKQISDTNLKIELLKANNKYLK